MDNATKYHVGNSSTIDSSVYYNSIVSPISAPWTTRLPTPGHFRSLDRSSHRSSLLTEDSITAFLTQHTCAADQHLSAHPDYMVQSELSYFVYSNSTPRGWRIYSLACCKCLSWETWTFSDNQHIILCSDLQHSADGTTAKICKGFKSICWVWIIVQLHASLIYQCQVIRSYFEDGQQSWVTRRLLRRSRM
jgi:hypothetical protein